MFNIGRKFPEILTVFSKFPANTKVLENLQHSLLSHNIITVNYKQPIKSLVKTLKIQQNSEF